MKKYILVLIMLCLLSGCSFMNKENIKITQFKANTDTIKKELNITKFRDRKEIEEYISMIDVVYSDEMVDLVIERDIEITYNNTIRISINSKDMRFCYYENGDMNISSLAYLPDGFLDWISQKLK